MSERVRYDVFVEPELATQIDDYRRVQPTIPTRMEAIKMLIVAGLKAEVGSHDEP